MTTVRLLAFVGVFPVSAVMTFAAVAAKSNTTILFARFLASWTASCAAAESAAVRMREEPRLHYTHPGHLVGDVHPYYEQGTYHLIYVYDPGTWRVGRLQSADLLHWKEHPLSHTPAPVIPQVLPHYYVLQIIPDPLQGGYRTFYPYYGIRASHSRDLAAWQQADPPLVVPSLPGYGRMADPYPFWNEDPREYWMVVTLRKDGLPRARAGAFGYATSADLAHWTWRGELYSPGDMGEPELPSMFKMGRQWYLLGFPNDGQTLGAPTYRRSPSCSGPWTVPVPDRLDGAHFCAGRTAFDGRQRLLFGWIPRSVQPSGAQQWGGHLALPRQLYQRSDGRLAVRLESSVAKRIRGPAWFPQGGATLVRHTGDWRIAAARAEASHSGPQGTLWIEPSPPQIDLNVDITLPADGLCAGVVLEPPASGVTYQVVIDGSPRRLAVMSRDGTVRVQQATGALWGRTVRLRVLVDGDIVEAFLDDQYALAARMPESLTGARVGLFARGAADFTDIGLYRLLAADLVISAR